MREDHVEDISCTEQVLRVGRPFGINEGTETSEKLWCVERAEVIPEHMAKKAKLRPYLPAERMTIHHFTWIGGDSLESILSKTGPAASEKILHKGILLDAIKINLKNNKYTYWDKDSNMQPSWKLSSENWRIWCALTLMTSAMMENASRPRSFLSDFFSDILKNAFKRNCIRIFSSSSLFSPSAEMDQTTDTRSEYVRMTSHVK